MKQFIKYRLFFHFNHNNVSTLQLHLKSEKYKLNKNMEGIVKYNIKKKKTLVTQNQEIRQVTYMLFYTECKTFNFEKHY